MSIRFLQLNTLTSYKGVLLNRDDLGRAKRLTFGNTSRIRVSSQAAVRRRRTASGPFSLANLGLDMAIRSRRTFEAYILDPLTSEHGVDAEVAGKLTETLLNKATNLSAERKAKEANGSDRKTGRTNQVTVFGPAEVEFLKGLAVRALEEAGEEAEAVKRLKAILDEKDMKLNIKALQDASGFGLDVALHGRMTTGDIFANVYGAMHTAHIYTVHEEMVDVDPFATVDDLVEQSNESGSGFLDDQSLTSGLYHGYNVLDIPQLISNDTGCPIEEWEEADRERAARITENYVMLVATESIGAKKGSTAPYKRARLLMAEATDHQPYGLDEAYEKAVEPKPDLIKNALSALAAEIQNQDAAYGKHGIRRVSLKDKPYKDILDPAFEDNEWAKMLEVAQWAGDVVRGKHG